MRVALAHDYLTQRGGAERVAAIMTHAFPDAPLYTSLYEPTQTFDEFRDVDVRTSPLQRVAAFRSDPRLALMALPAAWSRTRAEGADVVVASSSGWAHGISVGEHCRKIIYCHNPARWIYQSDEYTIGRAGMSLLSAVRPYLKAWDRAAAATSDLYLVNSTVVAERVRRAYGIQAEVLHPPVAIDPSGPQRPVEGLQPGFWLTIARDRGYKNTRTVVEGIRLLKGERLVVAGAGAGDFDLDAPHVTSVGVVSDDQLRWLYANARALVSVSQEDFGLTPIEANAFGTPVAVLRSGGFLDSTAEGVSGVFIEADAAQAVRDALRSFPDFDQHGVRQNAQRFSVSRFTKRLQQLAGLSLTNDQN